MIVRKDQFSRWIGHVITCLIMLRTTIPFQSHEQSQQSTGSRNVKAWTVDVLGPLKNRRFLSKGEIIGESMQLPCLHKSMVTCSKKVSNASKLPQESDLGHDKSLDTGKTNPSKRIDLASFQVRDCTHGELNMVADIIMDSFYNYTDPTSVWKQLTKLAELNRIQQNFPYGSDKAHHRMMVITTKNSISTTNAAATKSATTLPTTTIYGFVDIDTRIPNRPTSYKFNPRPYLSDLCIHPNYRRYGLASLIIAACEEYCRSHYVSEQKYIISDQVPELFIRVESKNNIAIKMYQKIGYSILSDHADSDNANILILYKRL